MKYRKKPVEIEAMRLIGDAAETFKVCGWIVANGYPWLVGDALDPETLRLAEEGIYTRTSDGRMMRLMHDKTDKPDKGIWIRPKDGALMIRTLEGDMEAPYGWWIIKGVKGEFYSCRDDIFRETYEEVKDDWDALAETIEYNNRVYATFRNTIK